MTSRAAELERRRAALLTRSAQLRSELTESVAQLGGRLRFVDTTGTVLRTAGGRVLLGCAAALLLFRGPRRAFKIAGPIALIWPIVRPWLPRLYGWVRELSRT